MAFAAATKSCFLKPAFDSCRHTAGCNAIHKRGFDNLAQVLKGRSLKYDTSNRSERDLVPLSSAINWTICLLFRKTKTPIQCSVIFIREKRRTNKDGSTVTYLRLAENRRVGDKVRQRVLCTLGRLDDPTLPRRLKALVETASRYAEVERLVLSEGIRSRSATWGPEGSGTLLRRDHPDEAEQGPGGAGPFLGEEYREVADNLRVKEVKVAEDARYDGKWILRTNTDLPHAEVALAYKGLWQVEEAFRTLKTPLELRPIYHWSESRVRGHAMVCVLAFIMRQHLRLKLKGMGWEGSFSGLLEALGRVRATEVGDRAGHKHRFRDEIPAEAMPAFRALGMALPKRVEKVS